MARKGLVDKEIMLYSEPGGKDYSKSVILRWLRETDGSNYGPLARAMPSKTPPIPKNKGIIFIIKR